MTSPDPPARQAAPSLLDRLVDERPVAPADALLRDLGWLFNATRSGVGTPDDLALAGSVLNFGVAPWAGRPASADALRALAESLRQAIGRFEPRLSGPSVVVRPELAPEAGAPSAARALAFRIDAVGAADPSAAPICLHTELDPDSGRVRRLEHRLGRGR